MPFSLRRAISSLVLWHLEFENSRPYRSTTQLRLSREINMCCGFLPEWMGKRTWWMESAT